ncbi:hypothetical protein [Bacteriophage sp.]|nr:hypothetical protein [Caudoviricetes sp.]UOF80007.1 hypothetical protein [Bacteriophage sp.]
MAECSMRSRCFARPFTKTLRFDKVFMTHLGHSPPRFVHEYSQAKASVHL